MFLRPLIITLLWVTSSFSQTVELACVRIYKHGGTNNAAKNTDKYPEATGSGWLITNDQVVTAYHVIKNHRKKQSVMVRFVDGYKSWAIVEAVHKKHDIALLWISPHSTITPVEVSKRPDRGAKVIIHGFGYDYEYRTHEGILSVHVVLSSPHNVKNQENGPWSFIAGEAAIKGDSGGPATHNGKVIGSVLSTLEGGSVIVDIATILKAFKDKLHVEKGNEIPKEE